MEMQEEIQVDSAVTTARPQRRHELDLLRGLVVLALIPYHAATYFVTGEWAPWRYAPSPVVTVLVAFAILVAMPLMFFISGMGIHFSLRKRTAGAFVGERFLRLTVPLAVGHLLLLPPIQYFALRRSPLFVESLAQFYPSFFDVTLKLGFPPLLTGPRYMAHHLWFLKDLLAYTLMLLPVFLWLRSRSGQGLIERLAAFCARPWAIFLLALPLAAIEASLGAKGGWNRFSYPVFLLYGYLIVADPRFGQALRGVWRIGLLGGLLLFATVGVAGIYLFSTAGIDFQTDPGLPSILFRLLKGIVVWCLLVGIMGLGQSSRPAKTEDRSAQRLQDGSGLARKPSLVQHAAAYLREAVLPIYTLHLTFVVVIGFYVVQWTSSMWARFLIITIVSTLGTLAAYDMVRRTRLTRFLFGMRLRRAVPPPLGTEHRTPGGWLRANLPHLGLWAAAALLTVLVVLAGDSAARTPVGKWEQTFDSTQAASGYIAEFREDGTWAASAQGQSIEGTYELPGSGQIRISYPDGTVGTATFLITADRFGLFTTESGRQQVFMRIR